MGWKPMLRETWAGSPCYVVRMTIYLMGLRGSGKSTVGRLLASRLGGGFVDLDDLTPAVLGCATAAEALTTKGEPAFRSAERQALDDPRVRGAAVVALGGGTPTHAASAEELRKRVALGDQLVYLRASVETLIARLAATDLSKRPSLTGADPLAEVGTVWARRDPVYLGLATAIVEVDGRTEAEVVDRVAAAIGGGRP